MNQAVRNKAFDVLETMQLKNRVKQLEYDNAELVKSNEELRERCKKLATKPPEWPKGYRPTRKLEDISIKEIIEAIEGPVQLTNCIDNKSDKCNLTHICITKNTWGLVNRAVKDTLHNIKIEDIKFISRDKSLVKL